MTPEMDSDYQQDCFLRKDGTVLGPDLRDSEIARIMPETVSRFFLFDGEILQQYEELLRNESDMGRNIKEAIERILGVPVLTNGRADLSELLKDAQKLEAKAAQRNQKTQSLGNQHEASTLTRLTGSCPRSSSLPSGPTPPASCAPPAAANPGIRRVGCGDGRLLTERERSVPRGRTALFSPT